MNVVFVFLDANVLFSAAYRKDAGVAALWELTEVELVSSEYAVQEARRNLEERDQLERLEDLAAPLRLVASIPDPGLPEDVSLPQKDRPILLAAINAGATHLLTGDFKHFGPLYGRRVVGVRILAPGSYLRRRKNRKRFL